MNIAQNTGVDVIDVAVFTCAKYAHLIPKWLRFFERTFPLPYHLDYIVAGTNTIRVPTDYHKNVTLFSSTPDNGFAANMLAWLRGKDEPMMMMMDDHILFEADVALLAAAWDIIHRADVGCVRLVPWPGPTLPAFPGPYGAEGYTNFGEIDKTLEYAISLQASMWKPQTLCDLIDPAWNPWEIELKGSQRAAHYDSRFIGCKTCAVNYKDYMMRGSPRPDHAAWVDANI